MSKADAAAAKIAALEAQVTELRAGARIATLQNEVNTLRAAASSGPVKIPIMGTDKKGIPLLGAVVARPTFINMKTNPYANSRRKLWKIDASSC